VYLAGILNYVQRLVYSKGTVVIVHQLAQAWHAPLYPEKERIICNEVETGGHSMMSLGPAAFTLKDMPVRAQHAWF